VEVKATPLTCAGCGAQQALDEPLPFRCPNAGRVDDSDHVLARGLELEGTGLPAEGEPNPFLRFRRLLYSWHWAQRAGLSDADYARTVDEVDAALATTSGSGFAETPYARHDALASEVGVAALWVKDETGGVGGSHKARHLMGPLLQIEVARRAGRLDRPPRLAIASCGNAALAAAELARARGLALCVFVPERADASVLAALEGRGAEVVRCRRPPSERGDPCVHRFRESLGGRTLPFTCQGSENALVIEGGATLGWELAAQHAALSPRPLERLVVQVGGGALASACALALREARALGVVRELPRIHTVQTEGGHPLERAWRRVAARIVRRLPAGPPASDDRTLAGWICEYAGAELLESQLEHAARHRSEFMWPWESEPRSVATGILDDETYDWHAVLRAMLETGGWPLVVSEETLVRAHELARRATGTLVSVTGAAGLAGVLELQRRGALSPDEHVAVLFTGAAR